MKPDKSASRQKDPNPRAIKQRLVPKDNGSGAPGHLDHFQEHRCKRNGAVSCIKVRRCMK